jgi:ketosteroid isomerase-like protein
LPVRVALIGCPSSRQAQLDAGPFRRMESRAPPRDTEQSMSEQNVELARRSILGWNDRGVDALLENLEPDVEFHPPKESMNPGVYRGPDGVRTYFNRLSEVLENQRIESVDVIDVDETRVIAVAKGFAKTPHFDGEVEMNWAWLITVQDGMATHVVTFTDRAQALDAARVV